MSGMQGDTLRAVLDTVFQSGAYDWVPDRDPFAWLRHAWEMFTLWVREAHGSNPLAFRLVAASAVIVLLLIVGHALWVFFRGIRTDSDEVSSPALPSAPPRDAAWWRWEAERHAVGGRYRAAIEADFRALLLSLEGRAVLRVHPSATPAEYARSGQFTPAARREFEETVQRLYGYLFAQWPCGPEEYAAWQDATDPDRYARAH